MKRLLALALLTSVAACKIPIGAVPCNDATQCAGNEVCSTEGVCTTAPPCSDTTEYVCNHVCTPINTTMNCGACNTVCSAGMECTNGACAIPIGRAIITVQPYADQGATGLPATVTSGDPTATYSWTIAGGTFADGTLAATGAAIKFNAGTGSAVVLNATGINTAGATESGQATVGLVPPLPANIVITTAPTVTANSTGVPASVTAIPNVTYAWTITNGTLAAATGTSVTYTAGASGQVGLAVVATNPSGTTANGSATVQIAPAIVSSQISTVASVPVGQSGNVASIVVQSGITLSWSIVGGSFDPGTSITASQVTFTAGVGPTVVLTCTATNAAGATQNLSATVQVTIAAPTNLSAVGGANMVALRWDGVAGATKYNILRSTVVTGPMAQWLVANTTNINDTALPNGKRYYYQVEAATNYVMSTPSAMQTAVTNLPAPANLTAANGATIALSWSAVPDAAGYAIYRKTGTLAFALLGGAQSAAFTDGINLTEGVQYTYMVHAVTPDNVSADSNSASAITTLDAASDLTAVASNLDVTLTWVANPAATSYEILRSTSPTGGFQIIDNVSGATYCNCGNTAFPPAPATTYYYEVRGTTSATESDPSNVATATTVFGAPGTVTSQIINRDTVVLTWAAVPGAPSYGVLRATSPNGPFVLVYQGSDTSFTDANLPYGTSFYYEVVVISAAGEGEPSAVVGVTTQASAYLTGAGVFGGEVQAVAFDPAHAGVAWAGVQGGAGVYISADSGATWTANGSGLGSNAVHALAFSKGTAFAAARGAGIFTLAPGTSTWVAANSGLVATDTYPSLASDPSGTGVVYAASYASVYSTTDNGNSWKPTTLNPASPITAVAVSPADPKTAYAATDGSGVYVTADGGATWNALGPESAGVQGGLVVDPNNAARIWIGTSAGVFVTTNGGQSWSPVGSLAMVKSIAWASGNLFASVSGTGMMVSDGSGDFSPIGGTAAATGGVTTLAVSGSNMIAGSFSGAGLFRSTNAGSTWSVSDTGIAAASSPAVAVAKSSPKTVYGIAGYSVVRSADGGATWVSAMGTGITYPLISSSIVVDPTSPKIVYVGAQGVLRSADGGATWATTNANFVPSSMALASSSTAFAAVYGGGIYKSTNINGATPSWSALSGISASGMRVVAVAPTLATQIYAGGDSGFWTSADSGTTWSNPTAQLQYVRSIAVDPNSPSTVYVVVGSSSSSSQVLQSTDAGATFTDLGFGSTAVQNLTSIAVDPTHSNILYVLGTASNGSTGGLWRSSTAGTAWTDVSAGLGTRMLRAVALDPITSGTVFVASDNNGLLVTSSGGI